MRVLTAFIPLLLTVAIAGSASASTVSKDGATVAFTAAPGEWNEPIVTQFGGDITVTDDEALQAGAGCTRQQNTGRSVTVRCPAAGVTQIVVTLGDGNDSASLSLNSASPAVTVRGGPGTDAAGYPGGPVSTSLDGVANDGPAARDNIEPDVENAYGSSSDDTLTGSASGNRLDPRGGADGVAAGDGDDFIDARDIVDCESEGECHVPARDQVTCGDGFDTVDADRIDQIASDCERVVRADVVLLTTGGDRFTGFRRSLRIFGRAGADRISGRGGDTIEGGSGNDVLRGADGANSLRGGSGRDAVVGSAGRDYVAGGYGNDRLYGRAGKDEINGGAGHDRIWAGRGNDIVVSRDRGAQRDRVSCGSGRDIAVVDRRDRVSRNCERRLTRDPRRR